MEGIQKKVRILFVDDEIRILNGLRRMLYSMRDEWDMQFADSGKKALELLKKEGAVDIVVSDMRMPEMDGAILLGKVKEVYPQTICFILSGYSDKEMIMRTVGPADQFLAKPCDAETLKRVISHALFPQEEVDETKLKRIVSNMKSIPTLPKLFTELTELLESEKSSFQEIAAIVKKDVGVSAKILQLVNSAFFGLRHRVDDIHRAVTYLGIDTIKSIIITTDVFSQFDEHEVSFFKINELYEHSFRVGIISGKLITAGKADKEMADSTFMCGMLHDIGKMVLIKNCKNEYEQIFNKLEDGKQSPIELEKKYFGLTHAEVGGYLVQVWGLSDDIIKAVQRHHNVYKALDEEFNKSAAVYIANAIDHKRHKKKIELHHFSQAEQRQLEKLDLVKKLPEWRVVLQMIEHINEA